MLIRRTIAILWAVALILGAAGPLLAGSGPKASVATPALSPVEAVYLNGLLVQWHAQSGGRKQALLSAGPWLIGARTKDKPRDGRLNLYIVAPGKQRHSDNTPQYDHNLVINALPRSDDKAAEWDVYLAVVLDPSLKEDLQTERELILARQQSFAPSADFKFSDIPGAAFLKEFLKFQSIDDLEGLRRRDGTLPRLILVPTQVMVRATASPEEPPAETNDELKTAVAGSAPPAEPKEAKPEVIVTKPDAPAETGKPDTNKPPQ